MDERMMQAGFGLLLVQNESAKRRYDKLTEAEKEQLLYRLRGAESKSELQRFVDELTVGPYPR